MFTAIARALQASVALLAGGLLVMVVTFGAPTYDQITHKGCVPSVMEIGTGPPALVFDEAPPAANLEWVNKCALCAAPTRTPQAKVEKEDLTAAPPPLIAAPASSLTASSYWSRHADGHERWSVDAPAG